MPYFKAVSDADCPKYCRISCPITGIKPMMSEITGIRKNSAFHRIIRSFKVFQRLPISKGIPAGFLKMLFGKDR
jgi:hypothetical protein